MIQELLKPIYKHIKIVIFRKKWRQQNRHNFTIAKNIFPINKVNIGEMTYGPLEVNTYGNPDEKLIIGAYCSIADGVKFLLGGEHPSENFSTYPFNKYLLGKKENTITKGPRIIEDDVWIGERCLILSGVKIGQGAIIAAGSIVIKNIPPYAVYGNFKIIKYRFSDEIIKHLIEFNLKSLNKELIKQNSNFLYKKLDRNLLDEITKKWVKEQNE